jgi:hypothetical protein
LGTKSDQLEWRRSKVVEMRSRDLSHGEIAYELQVLRASITSDIAYLRNHAKESIKEYVTEYLPEKYQICLCALDIILKHAFEILETSDDNLKAAGNGIIQGYTYSQAGIVVQCYNHR